MAKLYYQRIYDSTAGWVYYTKDVVDAAPSSGETTPNHTDNLVAATHEVLSSLEDSKVEEYVAEGSTSDGTQTVIWTDPSGPRLIVVEALVGARETGLTRSDHKHFKILATTFASTEGTWTVVTTEGIAGAAGAAAWAADFILSGSDEIQLAVTGEAATTIEWFAKITVRTS
jgi:hypothetical protein